MNRRRYIYVHDTFYRGRTLLTRTSKDTDTLISPPMWLKTHLVSKILREFFCLFLFGETSLLLVTSLFLSMCQTRLPDRWGLLCHKEDIFSLEERVLSLGNMYFLHVWSIFHRSHLSPLKLFLVPLSSVFWFPLPTYNFVNVSFSFCHPSVLQHLMYFVEREQNSCKYVNLFCVWKCSWNILSNR